MGPPAALPSPIPPSSEKEYPHPFGKGRGGGSRVLASEAARAHSLSPHPSLEGRGSWPGRQAKLEARGREQRWWWREGGGRRRVKFNRDGVDGGLKLRSPSKITLDMSACKSDSKIKCVLLF